MEAQMVLKEVLRVLDKVLEVTEQVPMSLAKVHWIFMEDPRVLPEYQRSLGRFMVLNGPYQGPWCLMGVLEKGTRSP